MERSASAPAARSEESFPFMNRVRSPFWERVRTELDEWFADYTSRVSPEKASDLRARFRSSDPRQHQPAWWELYLFRFLRLRHPDSQIEVEPGRGESSTSPDFCVLDEFGNPALYLEAVAPFAGFDRDTRFRAAQGFVLDAIDGIESNEFMVMIGALCAAPEFPKRAEIIRPIKNWLAKLDHAEIVEAYSRRASPTRHRVEFRGWSLELTALPRTTQSPGPRGLIVAGPVVAGAVDDVQVVRVALQRKASHYGSLGCPFVIGLLPSSPFFSTESALDALFGSEVAFLNPNDSPGPSTLSRARDGFWASAGPVSAVMFGARILPWTVATHWPHIWCNPVAEYPLGDDCLGLPVAKVSGHSTVGWTPSQLDPPAAFFRLPAEWPGPDKPFLDDG
jgi:hypothetical protein